jgi:hypothetical protein
LQARAGNAAVSRLLARQPTATPVDPLRKAYDKARVERDAFAKSAKRGPQTYDPAKRNADNCYGGFDVEYDPSGEQLLITLRGAVLFLPGITLGADKRAVAPRPTRSIGRALRAHRRAAPARRAGRLRCGCGRRASSGCG